MIAIKKKKNMVKSAKKAVIKKNKVSVKMVVVKKPKVKVTNIKKKKVIKKLKPKTKVISEKKPRALDLRRSIHNPIINPDPDSHWQSEAVFNPGVVVINERIHLFYRALGPDGVSRIGYASSKDGIHFDRCSYPVYMPETMSESVAHHPYTSPARLKYDTGLYASGGGWGGCEDPRAVNIDDRIHMTFNLFNGWNSIVVGMSSISVDDLEKGRWNWRRFVPLSPVNERHKCWMLFPEKIQGKFALLHSIHDVNSEKVHIEYIEDIEKPIKTFKSFDPHLLPNQDIAWHNRIRSAGAPPVKTDYGWLLFYHAMDKNDPNRYKLGVLLLDLKDPQKILYRSNYPILEPDEWYENNWKPGIIYASGAIVKDGMLFIYYGGGDKHIGVASANLDEFVKKLMKNEHAVFSVKSIDVE